MDRVMVMRSFVAAADAGGFSGGARELGLSSAAVARHVAELERELGVVLVNRSARSISLTDEGRHYLEFSKHVIGELEQEDASILAESERAEGPLAILAPKWTGDDDLTVAIAAFARDHPRIAVTFDVADGPERTYDFLANGYDLEFHTKELRDSSVKVRRVAVLPFALCASSGYLSAHGQVEDVSDLAHHRCLIHENEPVWHFHKDGSVRRFKVTHDSFTSNTYLALKQAVLEGAGIGLVPLRPMLGDVRAGRVQVVLPSYEMPPRPLYVAYAPGQQSVKKLRVFLDYVADWFQRLPADTSVAPATGAAAATSPAEPSPTSVEVESAGVS